MTSLCRLRVARPSGQELAIARAEECQNVAALKRHLRELYGFPVYLQQLLHEGNLLEDDAELAVSMDLQLVLLTISGHWHKDNTAPWSSSRQGYLLWDTINILPVPPRVQNIINRQPGK